MQLVSEWRNTAYDRKLAKSEFIIVQKIAKLKVEDNAFLIAVLESSTNLINRLSDIDAELATTIGQWLLCPSRQSEDQPAPGLAGLFRLIEELRTADTAGSDLTGHLAGLEKSVIETDTAINDMTSLVPAKARASFKSAYRQFRTEMGDALLDYRFASPVALDDVHPSSGAALLLSREGGSMSRAHDQFDFDVVAKNMLRVVIRNDPSLRWVANQWVSLCVHAEASTTPESIAAEIADSLGMTAAEVSDQLHRIRGILLDSARRGL